MSQPEERPLVIIGAGIIGLTTAVRLLESQSYQRQPRPIHILADHLPNDPLDAKYASTIAGAHHLSFADDGDQRQRRWDMTTFKTMYEEWRQYGEASGLMALTQNEFFVRHKNHLKIYEEHPDFVVVARDRLPAGVDHGVTFTSLTITPITYLNHLLDRISTLSRGQVKIHRHHLPSLDFISHPSTTVLIGLLPPHTLFVCVGLGAITLGGVKDETVYPTRGQIVKIKAPWIRSGFTCQVGSLAGGEGGERTYVIPRANGEVILGGTREEGDWEPYPREDTKKDILRRALILCPELAPPHLRGKPLDNSSEHLLGDLVLDHLVGFRPSRKDGPRLEQGPVDLYMEGKFVDVIYNYGHGGAGYQSSWGCAEEAVHVFEKACGYL
ncbi:hypothetical protein B9479_001536 [Cryptococcus floricola]|uniref:FAD dependent oxidoreductase domain-containing protein n=1 Tax=Cryptococcus floricola TaxID=2591691 RepID=A0A5D3B3S8_9TREE|nr:hypothetical protein B9479_001536 [Cryptococcus floricola]